MPGSGSDCSIRKELCCSTELSALAVFESGPLQRFTFTSLLPSGELPAHKSKLERQCALFLAIVCFRNHSAINRYALKRSRYGFYSWMMNPSRRLSRAVQFKHRMLCNRRVAITNCTMLYLTSMTEVNWCVVKVNTRLLS